MLSKNNRKHASIALEAALVMPVVLLMTAQWISLVLLVNVEMRLQGALDKTAAELSLLSPLCGFLEGRSAENEESAGDSAAGQTYDADADQAAAGTSELIDALQAIWPGQTLLPVLQDAALDLASSTLLSQFVQYRLAFWLKDAGISSGDGRSSLRDRRLYLDWQLDRCRLWLCLSYQVQTPLGRIKRYTAAVVPLWLGHRQPTVGSAADDIWQQDNFTRGHLLRARFGGNLPYDFPVVAAFSDGEALMIKSADLTAPTYQDQSAVRSLFTGQIMALSQFEGSDYIRDGISLQITRAMITRRRLLIIIPENCDQAWLDGLISALTTSAEQAGVELEVVRFGHSRRYAVD